MDWAAMLEAPPSPGPVDVQPSDPTLSVLIPAYNSARTLGDAVESVLVQRPAPLEVIVSDDGSEDDIDRVLSAFGDRVRVVRGPNKGLPTARNRAATVARGELLGLLDADDVWLPGRAAALTSAAAARPDLSIVTTDAVIVKQGSPVDGAYYDTRRFEVGDQVAGIIRENFVFGAGAVRARALRAVGGYNPVALWAEDWDLWMRMIFRGHRAGMVRLPLYEYRQRAGSLSARTVDLSVGVLSLLERARDDLPSTRYRQLLDRTEREWRAAAVWYAKASRDPRRQELARDALRAGGLPMVTRARFLMTSLAPTSRPRV